MCGVFGFVSFDGPLPDDVDVRGLRDRGPDNVGRLSHDNVTLVHTRLAVIDRRQSSNQPIASDGLALVCNGEIYNHRTLRRDDYAYRTESDCEAVLAVYAQDGAAGFARLDGMFSFVLLDRARKKLLLHRDPIGKKPLYYYRDAKRFVVASNVSAIVDNCPDAAEIDPEQVQYFLRHGSVHPGRSIYRRINPVLPGEIVEVDLRSAQVGVQQSGHARPAPVDIGREEADRELQRLLRGAVEKRIQGLERPVLIFSGGIDSTLLAEELLRASGNLTLISLRQPLPFLRDEPYARYAAHRWGKPIHWVNPRHDLKNKIETAISKLDQPLSIVSYYFLSMLTLEAEQFGNVLFTGDGADEIFHGYVPFSRWTEAGEPIELHGVRCGPEPVVDWGPYGRRQGIRDLVGHGMVKVDKATAENRMEGRCPFLDRDLMRFTRSLPASYWRQKDAHKWPLKDRLTAMGYPRRFVHRKKIGFAYSFRLTMLPWMASIRRYVAAHQGELEALGVATTLPRGRIDTFRNFMQLWSHYVLARFAAR